MSPNEMAEIIEAARHERYAVLLGPSGSGKSILLWRAARDVVLGARVLRVRRCANAADVSLLLRHVRLLKPSTASPVVVAGDNLGRAGMEEWPSAVDALREISAVILIGAVRAEDFTPRILRGGARVIEPRLDHQTAVQIAEAVREAGIPIRMEEVEAELQADELLMEFIALLTTGHRLEQVVSEQVDALRQPGRELQRTLARLVTAAHTAGVTIPANSFGSLATSVISVDSIGDALSVLRGEHVLTSGDDDWRGLHELRSEVITRLLHESPPPTLAQTYSELVNLLRPDATGWILRRAAEVLGESGIQIADALAPRVALDLSARDVAIVLEGAERADNLLYARTCLPILCDNLRSGITVEQLALLVYPTRNQGFGREPTGFGALDQTLAAMRNIANQMPVRTSPMLSRVGARLDAARLVEMTEGIALLDVVRLMEAAEDLVSLTSEDAADVYARFGHPSDVDEADLHARLISSLVAAADLTAEECAHVFGPVSSRAAMVVRPDPSAIEVTVDESDRVVKATIMHSPMSGQGPPSLPWDPLPRASSDRANDVAVRMARRLADACPEATTVEVVTISASGRLLRMADHEWAQKRMERTAFPRHIEVRRNIGFQAALRRLTAAESWTKLISDQVEISQELVGLIRDAPDRLLPHDNDSRRRDWIDRVELLSVRAAELASRPSVGSHDPEVSDAHQDDDDRSTDLTSDALRDVTSALSRLLTEIGYGSLASTLNDAKLKIDEARSVSDPWLVGLGRPLPGELTDLLEYLIEILVAAHRDSNFLRGLRRTDLQTMDRTILIEAARESQDRERVRLENHLDGISNVGIHQVVDPESLVTNFGGHAWFVTVPMEGLNDVSEALQGFRVREGESILANVFVAAVGGDTLLPLAFQLTHVGERRTLPMTPEMIEPYVDQLNLHRLEGQMMTFVRTVIDALVVLSVSFSIEQRREPQWPSIASVPGPTLDELRDRCSSEFGATAGGVEQELQESLTVLIDQVQAERDGVAQYSLAGEITDGQGLGPSDDSAPVGMWESIHNAMIASIVMALPTASSSHLGAQNG